jgi:hypothetical protein
MAAKPGLMAAPSARALLRDLAHTSAMCECAPVRRDLAMVEQEIADLEEAVRRGDAEAAVELRELRELRDLIEARLLALAA